MGPAHCRAHPPRSRRSFGRMPLGLLRPDRPYRSVRGELRSDALPLPCGIASAGTVCV